MLTRPTRALHTPILIVIPDTRMHMVIRMQAITGTDIQVLDFTEATTLIGATEELTVIAVDTLAITGIEAATQADVAFRGALAGSVDAAADVDRR